MTNQILGALELGLVYGLMVLGVFIIAIALSVKPVRSWLNERKNRQRRKREAAKEGGEHA